MLSKKRSSLRAEANKIDTTLIIGKNGLGQEIFNQAFNIVNKNEILKGKVLKTSALYASEAAKIIAENIGAEVVCGIGSKFILYKKKESKKENKRGNKKQIGGKNRSGNKGEKPRLKLSERKLKIKTRGNKKVSIVSAHRHNKKSLR